MKLLIFLMFVLVVSMIFFIDGVQKRFEAVNSRLEKIESMRR